MNLSSKCRWLIAFIGIGCVAQGPVSHRLVCADGGEASHDAIGSILGPARTQCIRETLELLDAASKHRTCKANADCFAYNVVQASRLGCIAASTSDALSIQTLKKFQTLRDEGVCPVASIILEDCGSPRCNDGLCGVDVQETRVVACKE
jgi:hypothetical protein